MGLEQGVTRASDDAATRVGGTAVDAPFQLTRAYLYRQPAQGRIKRTVHGQRRRNAASLKHAAGAREPWLLVSKLAPRRKLAALVVAIYRTRMAIEQSFRDLKAHRHGFAFRQNLGRDAARVANLLLIAALAMLATWLTGIVGRQRGLAHGLQANTERRAPVLSIFFIGTRLLQQRLDCSFAGLRHALRQLTQSIKQHEPLCA